MKTPEARKLIGKLVEWDTDSILCPKRRGVVGEVCRKNIRIDGDWKWLPDIKELRVVEETYEKK